MSVPYAGNYSYLITDLEDNGKKRYMMAIQKGKPILDKEVTEIAFRDLDFFRSYNKHNVNDAAFGETDFQIQESSISNVNNFKVAGGTANDPAILVVKGYPLVLFSDIEYNQQDDTGALTDDDFTESAIPALTTPGAPRTDEVYVDTYLAEVSSEVGSEYQDTSIKDSVLALQTANRWRIVQDIRVAEGSTTPSDGVDGNGIYHRYLKLATLNRLNGDATITSAMIVDDRTVVNTNKSYEDGTALTIKLKDGEDIGDATHGIGTLFMASSIDYRTDLGFISGTENVTFKTNGDVGIGTTDPASFVTIHKQKDSNNQYALRLSSVGPPGLTAPDASALILDGYDDGSVRRSTRIRFWQNGVAKAAFIQDYDQNSSGKLDIIMGASSRAVTLDSSGQVGIGSTQPANALDVNGSVAVANDLTVDGTTTTIHSEVTITDQMEINQTDDQSALIASQDTGGTTATVVRIENAGDGYALTTDNGNVGIGSTQPTTLLQVDGVFTTTDSVGLGTTDPSDYFHFYRNESESDLEAKFENAAANGDMLLYLDATNNASLNFQRSGSTKYYVRVTSGDDFRIYDEINDKNFFLYDESAATLNLMSDLGADGFKVGIGTTAPDSEYHFWANDPGSDVEIHWENADGTADLTMFLDAVANSTLAFQKDGSTQYFIRSTGADNFRIYDEINDKNFFQYLEGSQTLNLMGDLGADGYKVGIGTTNPQTEFHFWQNDPGSDAEILFENDDATSDLTLYLDAGNNPTLSFLRSGVAKYYIRATSGDDFRIYDDINNKTFFYYDEDAATLKLMENLGADGYKVGIGTTAPQSELHFWANDTGSDAEIKWENADGTSDVTMVLETAGNNATLRLNRGGADKYFLRASSTDDFRIYDDINDKNFLYYDESAATLNLMSDLGADGFKVGIGTTNPQAEFHYWANDTGSDAEIKWENADATADINMYLDGGSNARLYFQRGGVSKYYLQTTVNDDFRIYDDKNDKDVLFYDESADTLKLMEDHGAAAYKVGIGTTNPTEEFHFWINDPGSDAEIHWENADGTSDLTMYLDAGNNPTLMFQRGGVNKYYIRASAGDDFRIYDDINNRNIFNYDESLNTLKLIETGGEIGFGTTDPLEPFCIRNLDNSTFVDLIECETVDPGLNQVEAWLKCDTNHESSMYIRVWTVA